MTPARSRVLVSTVIGLLAILALGRPQAALADGEASGILVTPPVVKPGDEILVQGFALWTELPVTVELVGRTGASRPIGSGATGPDGTLALTLRLPDDVPAGQYTVLVRNVNGEEARAPVVVEAAFPIIPMVAIGGGLIVALLVAISARRRGRVAEELRPGEVA